MSEKWLARGEPAFDRRIISRFGRGHSRFCATLEVEAAARALPPRRPFAASFNAHLQGVYVGIVGHYLGPRTGFTSQDTPAVVANIVRYWIDRWCEDLTGPRLGAFFKEWLEIGQELAPTALDLEEDKDHSGKGIDEMRKVSQELTAQMAIDIPSDWPDLRDRLSALTAQRGDRANLAKEFGVTRQSVNGWIGGRAKPNAEITVQLVSWVIEAARKQKKDPDRVTSTAGADDPKQQIHANEKAKSDRRKR